MNVQQMTVTYLITSKILILNFRWNKNITEFDYSVLKKMVKSFIFYKILCISRYVCLAGFPLISGCNVLADKKDSRVIADMSSNITTNLIRGKMNKLYR